MNDLKIIENGEIATTDYKKVACEYLQNMGLKLPQKYMTQFIELATLYKLNPFKREIYAVGYGDTFNIITGYEVYIKRAERTGKLNGWDCLIHGNGKEMYAELTIYRKDFEHPFKHQVDFVEFAQKKRDGTLNSMWMRMPKFMLKKVCISQGFRMCFSDEFGGMPYTSDELPEIENQQNIENLKHCEVENSQGKNSQNEQQAKMLHARTITDCALNLESLITEYKNILDVETSTGNPYKMADLSLRNGSETEIQSMYERCKKYLSIKGYKEA